jgi:ATP/maltotriose-dependent transcriptional regulator MalT/DNA-binding SARP family transcriptional activator
LFHYLGMAARAMIPQGRPVAIPAVTPQNEEGWGVYARNFFEALGAMLPKPSVLVLDDYQEAQGEWWTAVVTEALSSLPKGISLIVLSRDEPPPKTARYLLAGSVSTLGWRDLRLNSDEVAGIVRCHTRRSEEPDVLSRLPQLEDLAGGWAAVLVLLLQGAHGATASATSAEPLPQDLFDYFAEEILERIEPAHRQFLLTTSVPSYLTNDLAERITQNASAPSILAKLVRRSYLTRQAGGSATYRYHPLLRTFLLRRAAEVLGPVTVRRLHRCVADGLLRAGQPADAIEHLEGAGEFDERIALILRLAPSYLAEGRMKTLESWISRLPTERVSQNGWLAYWLAICHLGSTPTYSLNLLEQAYETFVRAEDVAGRYLAGAAAIQAIVHQGEHFARLDVWLDQLEELRRTGPPCPPAMEASVALGMIFGLYFRRPGSPECQEWADRVRGFVQTAPQRDQRVMCGGVLAIYYGFYGEVGMARGIVEMLRESARSEAADALALITLQTSEAGCAWEDGENTACLRIVRESLALAEKTAIHVWSDHLCAFGAAAALSMGDCEAAREFLEPMARAAQQRRGFAYGNYHFYASWDAWLRGDLLRARHSADIAQRESVELGMPFATALSALAMAQVSSALHEESEAMHALSIARQTAVDTRCPLIEHACDLIEADMCWDKEPARARTCLERGLGLARKLGYYNMFWLPASTMARLAVRAFEENLEPAHAREIVRRRCLVPEAPPTHLDDWPWRLRIRALGTFEVLRVDESVAVRGVPLRLLQAVVALGGRDVPDEWLIDALWPDSDGDSGKRVFDTTLHRLRRQLAEDDVLRLDQRGIHINPRLCWIDLWNADEVLAGAQGCLSRSPELAPLERHARRILELVRGPLFGRVRSEEAWLIAARERFAAKVGRTLDSMGAALEQLNQYTVADELYERGIDLMPLNERLWAGRMRCLAESGRPTEALACHDCLHRELEKHGRTSGANLRALRDRLLSKT